MKKLNNFVELKSLRWDLDELISNHHHHNTTPKYPYISIHLQLTEEIMEAHPMPSIRNETLNDIIHELIKK